MKLKVIFSSYDSIGNPYYSGGGALSIHQIASGLANSYDCQVITASYPKSKNKKIDGIKYTYIGPKFIGSKLGQLFFIFYLPIYSIRQKYDIWLENLTPPFSASLLPIFSKNSIGIVHMLCGKDMERKYHLPFQIIEKLGLKLYKHLIVTSREISYQLKKNLPKTKIHIIPNPTIQYPYKKNKKKHILFIGRIEINQKGLDLLIEAYCKIPNPKPQLIIAGSGNKNEEINLKKIINNNGTKNIRFIGRVEGRYKQQLIQNSICIIVSSRFETFSIVALESLANKIPLITFDLKNLRWIPKSARIIAKNISSDDLAESIKLVIHKKIRLHEIVNIAYKHSQKYNVRNITELYKQTINKVHELT